MKKKVLISVAIAAAAVLLFANVSVIAGRPCPVGECAPVITNPCPFGECNDVALPCDGGNCAPVVNQPCDGLGC